MLKREIKVTNDGSRTLYIPEWNESYHSKHGALQEAEHVFIQNGLSNFSHQPEVRILEYGFGTGLNCLLSYLYGTKENVNIQYTALEKFPIEPREIKAMDFIKNISSKYKIDEQSHLENIYQQMHQTKWNQFSAIGKNFNLKKIQIDFRNFSMKDGAFHIAYYDAFGMRVQPELWNEHIFSNVYQLLTKDGLLTTYAANGKTKRALQSCGFDVQKLAGPPGKREMINAWKR